MKNKNFRSAGWCNDCWKQLYADRKSARQVCRLHHGRHKTVFHCPVQPSFYHIGELSRSVIAGYNVRDDFYPRAS